MKSKAEVMKNLATVRRRKITIQKRELKGKDKIGNQHLKWNNWKTLWVKRTQLYGAEYFSAKTHNEENTIVFVAKYVEFLRQVNSVDFQVVYEGNIFDIKKVDFLQDDGSFVKIHCLKRGAL